MKRRQRRSITKKERRQIYHDLCDVQDRYPGAGVDESRMILATRHGCTAEQIRQIEEQGLAEDWPIPEVAK